jgi:hypothetical protein
MERESDNKIVMSRDSCLNFEADLVAYLEGERTPALLTHAQHCEFCRCVLADIQQIRDLSSGFDLESPPPAVWTRIRETLVAEGVIRPRRSFWLRWIPRWEIRFLRSPVPIGALAAAAIATVVLLRSPASRTRPQVPQRRSVQAVAVPEFMPPADVAQLKSTLQQLEVAYRANESQLEPSIKATYEKSLTSLNDEIRECEDSIQLDPDNGLARQYLSTAYAQKAQLLQSALDYDLR